MSIRNEDEDETAQSLNAAQSPEPEVLDCRSSIVDRAPCNSTVSIFPQRELIEEDDCDFSTQPPKIAVCPRISIAPKSSTPPLRVSRCPLSPPVRRPRTLNDGSRVRRAPTTTSARGTSQTARPVATDVFSAAPSGGGVWIKWRQVFRDKGLMRAAHAISDQLCKFCDQQNRYDRRLNRMAVAGAEMPPGSDDCYNAAALDAFNGQIKPVLEGQFARWPRVYEKMPERSLVKRSAGGGSESDDSGSDKEPMSIACRVRVLDCDCF